MIDLIRVREIVAADMEDIQGLFKPGAKITVLVRAPGFPDRDFMMTDDNHDEAMAMIARCKAREQRAQPPAKIPAPPPVDRSARELAGGGPVTADHTDLKPDGQQKGYVVLTEAERAKGYQRPYRDAYRHLTCGAITTMSRAIAETYARDPHFYSGTFCSTCSAHFPVGEDGEFTWYEMDGSTGPKVGT